MYQARRDKIANLKGQIEAREKQIEAAKKDLDGLLREIHADCPACGGSNSVKFSGGYDSSSYWDPCPFPVKWLLGEEPTPTDWRSHLPRDARV